MRKNIILTAFATAFAVVANAQNYTTPFTPSLGFLSDEAYDYIVGETSGEQAYYHVLNWAPYERNRTTEEYAGDLGETKYILEKFKEYNLAGANVERFAPIENTWDGISGSVWEISPKRQKLADYRDLAAELLPGSANANVTAELVWVGLGTDKELSGLSLQGKILVTEQAASKLQDVAEKAGAVGIISYNAPRPLIDPVQIPNTRIRQDGKIFAFNLTPRDGLALRNRLLNGEKITVKADVKTQTVKGPIQVPTFVIPGTDGDDKEIILSAHLFEGFQKFGANDNLSGSAALLESARVLNTLINDGKLPRPRYSIRFLWVPEISGTIPWVNAHKDVTAKALGNLNFDMVGLWLSKSQSFFVLQRPTQGNSHFVGDVAENILHYISATNKSFCTVGAGRPEPLKPIFSVTGSHDPLYYAIDQYQGSSDHVIFNDFGVHVPGVMFDTWPDNYYHTSGDRPSVVDPTQLRRASVLASVAAYTIASADEQGAVRIAQEVATNGQKRLALVEQARLRNIANATKENLDSVYKHSVFDLDAYLLSEQEDVESVDKLFPDGSNLREFLEKQKSDLKALHDILVGNLEASAKLRASQLNIAAPVLTLTTEEEAASKIYPKATDLAHTKGFGALNELEDKSKDERQRWASRGYKDEIASLTYGGTRSILDIKKALDSEFPKVESLKEVSDYIAKLKQAGFVTY